MAPTPAQTVEVALEGEIDLGTIEPARTRLAHVIAAAPGSTISVDLSEVSFLGSTGMGMLVAARKQAKEAGGDLRVVRPQPSVRRVLEVTGLDTVLLEAPSAADLIRRASGPS